MEIKIQSLESIHEAAREFIAAMGVFYNVESVTRTLQCQVHVI